MPDYFVRVDSEEEDGEPTYQVVEADTILADEELTLPEDRVRAHSLFKQVDADRQKNLTETVERRKRIAELEVQLKAAGEGDDGEGDNSGSSGQATTIDPDALIQQAVDRVLEVQQERSDAQAERKKVMAAAAKKYSLPAEALTALAFVPDENLDAAAASMSAAGLRFEEGGSGGNSGDSKSALKQDLAELDAGFEKEFYGDEPRGTFTSE